MAIGNERSSFLEHPGKVSSVFYCGCDGVVGDRCDQWAGKKRVLRDARGALRRIILRISDRQCHPEGSRLRVLTWWNLRGPLLVCDRWKKKKEKEGKRCEGDKRAHDSRCTILASVGGFSVEPSWRIHESSVTRSRYTNRRKRRKEQRSRRSCEKFRMSQAE